MKCYKIFLVFILIAGSTAAQEIHGNLEGRISDYNNTPLSGANISITGGSLQGIRGSTSDDQGFFSILSIPPGLYNIKISYVGLQSIAFEHVQVRLGKTTSLGKVQLRQRDVNIPELVVSGKRFTSDPNSASYGGSILSTNFENLPVERNYQNMISLLPQANLSYYGDGVNIAGSTGFENKYFVDGVEVTDPLFGVFSTYLPYNFIKEVEVKAGGYEAEFRSALGGVVNVVTNSGTNEFHTSAFGFYTNNNFADHYEKGLLDPTQGNFNDYDVGVSLGGPIIRDKVWFFTAYNPTFANRDVSIPGFGIYVDRTIRHLLAAKLNWSAFEQLKFNFTASGDPTKRKAAGRGQISVPDNLRNPDLYLQDITEGGYNLSLNSAYSPSKYFLIDATGAFVMRHDKGKPLTARGNEPNFNDRMLNYSEGGVGVEWDAYRYTRTVNLTGSLSLTNHTLIAGVEYKVNGTDNQYNYNNIVRYDTSYYEEYIGGADQTVQQRMPSIFIQDSWKISNYLRLHAGVRWDGQYVIASNGKLAQSVSIPLQPRLGIILIPDKEGSNKFFGSFGRYSQELVLGSLMGLYSDQSNGQTNYYSDDPRNNVTADSSFYYSSVINSEIEGLRGQYFDEFSLGYERNLTKNIRVSAQGVYRVLQEAIDDGFVVSVSDFRIGNPGRGLLSNFPRPSREYKALIISFEQREDEYFNFLISYVLSRNYGNYEGLFDAVGHSEFPNRNWIGDNPRFASINTTGLLPNDRTHLLKISGSYKFSFGLAAGLSFTAQSGTPLNEYVNLGYLILLSERGSAGRTPPIWDLNARFVYELPSLYLNRARIIMDVFHIASQFKSVDIDQFHYYGVDENGNPIYPNPSYEEAFRYQQPMSMRLGIEMDF